MASGFGALLGGLSELLRSPRVMLLDLVLRESNILDRVVMNDQARDSVERQVLIAVWPLLVTRTSRVW